MDARIASLAHYVHGLRFEDLPRAVVHEAKRRFIDTVGRAIGGYAAAPSKMARAIAARYSGSSAARNCGSLQANGPAHAAFANHT